MCKNSENSAKLPILTKSPHDMGNWDISCNAAARVVSDTQKFDRGLSQLLHEDLHWLDVPQRIEYKLSVLVHRCQYGSAPQYLKDKRSLLAVTYPFKD